MLNKLNLYIAAVLLIVLLGIFSLNVIILSSVSEDLYLAPDDVRGVTVYAHDTPYTLSFEQQQALLVAVNGAELTNATQSDLEAETVISSIHVHRFAGDDVVITLQGYRDNELVFSLPSLMPGLALVEQSDGHLKSLLAESYD